MKNLLFTLILLFSPSGFTEIYYCKYKESENTTTISFDRTGHSHFKRCVDEKCDAETYTVIHADKDILIFGNIVEKENDPDSFQIFNIDKTTNLFTSATISFPKGNHKNKFISGECIVNY